MLTIVHRVVVIAVLVLGLLLAAPYRRPQSAAPAPQPMPDMKIQLAVDDVPPSRPRLLNPVETLQRSKPTPPIIQSDAVSEPNSESEVRRIRTATAADGPARRDHPEPRRLPPISAIVKVPTPPTANPMVGPSESAGQLPARLPSINKQRPPQPVRRRTGRLTTHRITDGDNLALLAEKYLRDESRSMEIFELNREILARPDLLPLGAEIRVYDERQ